MKMDICNIMYNVNFVDIKPSYDCLILKIQNNADILHIMANIKRPLIIGEAICVYIKYLNLCNKGVM